MVRGIQKQVIHVKNPENSWCEEAFLVVRAGAFAPPPSGRAPPQSSAPGGADKTEWYHGNSLSSLYRYDTGAFFIPFVFV